MIKFVSQNEFFPSIQRAVYLIYRDAVRLIEVRILCMEDVYQLSFQVVLVYVNGDKPYINSEKGF